MTTSSPTILLTMKLTYAKPKYQGFHRRPNFHTMVKQAPRKKFLTSFPLSSDEEDNDESMPTPKDAPDESTKFSSMSRNESGPVQVKEEIVDSRVVQTRDAHAAHSIVAENHPSTDADVQIDGATNQSPTKNGTPNNENSYLVLKEPLIQIFQIQHNMTDSIEEEIEEYWKKFHDKRCWNEQHLRSLRGLSEEELEDMIGFIPPIHEVVVKDCVKNLYKKNGFRSKAEIL